MSHQYLRKLLLKSIQIFTLFFFHVNIYYFFSPLFSEKPNFRNQLLPDDSETDEKLILTNSQYILEFFSANVSLFITLSIFMGLVYIFDPMVARICVLPIVVIHVFI